MTTSPEARRYLRTLATQYAADGFPAIHEMDIRPETEEEERIFCELVARGLFKQFTNAAWQLTEAGRAHIMR
jgi:hypothetical protein